MTDPDAVLGRMNEYNCATCDATGTSHGIRPAGWGMETTDHAPSTWRRWCPPCWRKHIGLDKTDGTCAHHGLGDVEATQAGDPERRFLRDCRGCGAHWEEFECGRCGRRNREPKACPCRKFATGGLVKSPGGLVGGTGCVIRFDPRVELVITAEDIRNSPKAQAALEELNQKRERREPSELRNDHSPNT